MRIAISGASGLVGGAVRQSLESEGHEILRFVRKPDSDPAEIAWSPDTGAIEAAKLEGVDAVIHLAGENIAGRWDQDKKARIYNSRVTGTRVISEALAGLSKPPRVLVCASAAGYYGNRGDQVLTEDSTPGDDFLARVCTDWEAAARPAADKGIRVVSLRFGVIVSGSGGALALMRVPFKLGLGGRLGDGQQYMPWVSLDDAVAAIHFALTRDDLCGPVNAVAPEPVTNAEFTKALGKVLRRPTLFPVPIALIRLVLGELADALTASAKIVPKRLTDAGFVFKYPAIEPALRDAI